VNIYKFSKLKLFLFLFFISLILYANSLSGDFILDDKLIIVDNGLIKHIRTIPMLFITQAFEQPGNLNLYEGAYRYYRPLMTLSFAMDYSIWKLNTAGYHLTNIAVHSLNAFLVYCLIYGLFINFPLALLSSILFCVHPIHSQSVSYITNRSELLVSLFTLMPLVFYIRYAKSRSIALFFISVFSFMCALLSREAGFLIFVPVFITLIGIKSRIPRQDIFLHAGTFTAILAIYIISRLTILVPLQILPDSAFSFFADILNFLRVLMGYSRLLILPFNLHILRTIAPIASFRLPEIVTPLIFLIFLVIALIVLIKQRKFILLFGVSWFILTLLYLIRFMYKVSGLISMEEQWVYLASIGFFVLLATLILSIKRQRLIIALSSFIIAIYGILTFLNNSHWKDEINSYRYNLRFLKPGADFVLRFNLANALYKKQLYSEAVKELNSMLSVNPDNWMAYIFLGDILRETKNYAEAKAAYQNAVKIDYFCWQANRKLKSLAQERGEVYKEEIEPALSPLESRIISYIRMGDFGEALGTLEKALAASPTPGLYILTGITFAKMGAYNQAIEALNYALKLDNQNIAALSNLAVVYERLRQFKKADEARQTLKQVIELKK
jgi:tetratricopeptide (TPR) repeat protein